MPATCQASHRTGKPTQCGTKRTIDSNIYLSRTSNMIQSNTRICTKFGTLLGYYNSFQLKYSQESCRDGSILQDSCRKLRILREQGRGKVQQIYFYKYGKSCPHKCSANIHISIAKGMVLQTHAHGFVHSKHCTPCHLPLYMIAIAADQHVYTQGYG